MMQWGKPPEISSGGLFLIKKPAPLKYCNKLILIKGKKDAGRFKDKKIPEFLRGSLLKVKLLTSKLKGQFHTYLVGSIIKARPEIIKSYFILFDFIFASTPINKTHYC